MTVDRVSVDGQPPHQKYGLCTINIIIIVNYSSSSVSYDDINIYSAGHRYVFVAITRNNIYLGFVLKLGTMTLITCSYVNSHYRRFSMIFKELSRLGSGCSY
jgi:hypothetical protein